MVLFGLILPKENPPVENSALVGIVHLLVAQFFSTRACYGPPVEAALNSLKQSPQQLMHMCTPDVLAVHDGQSMHPPLFSCSCLSHFLLGDGTSMNIAIKSANVFLSRFTACLRLDSLCRLSGFPVDPYPGRRQSVHRFFKPALILLRQSLYSFLEGHPCPGLLVLFSGGLHPFLGALPLFPGSLHPFPGMLHLTQ